MSEKKNIDKAFREKFEGFSVEPPSHLWNEISGQLLARKRKRRLATIGWISAAAVIVFAFMAGWYVNEKSKQETLVVTQQHKEPKQAPANNPIQPDSIENSGGISKPKQPVIQPEPHKAEPVILVAATNITEQVPTANSEENIPVRQRLINRLSTKNADLGQSAKFGLAEPVHQNIRQKTHQLTEDEKALMTANIQNQRKSKKDESPWLIGAYISPGYASHTSSYSSAYQQNMGSNASGGVSNLGGGVSVQYKTSKKVRIESGVYYARNTQSSGSSNYFYSNSPSYYGLSNGAVDYSDGEIWAASPVNVQRGEITMNSTAGVVLMNKTPTGAELTANAVDAANKNLANLISNGDFSQEFDFIEIPLYMRYRLLDKKIGIDVLGGLNAGIVVGNNAYISNQYGKQNIGFTDDISTLNLSGTIGVGLNYAMGNHFSLAFEPRVNYFLNSINTNPDVSYKPYRFGLFTGVYYAF